MAIMSSTFVTPAARADGSPQGYATVVCLDRDLVGVTVCVSAQGVPDFPADFEGRDLFWLYRDEVRNALDPREIAHCPFGCPLLVLPLDLANQVDPAVLDSGLDAIIGNLDVPA